MQKQGEKIAILIRARGWTQKEFAEHIGYSPEHLSRILSDESIKPRPLARIVKGLNIYPSLITDDTELRKGNMLEQLSAVTEPIPTYPADPEKAALLEEIKQLREENQKLKAALYDEMRLSGRLPEGPV